MFHYAIADDFSGKQAANTQVRDDRCAQARSRPEAPRNAAAERSDAALTALSTAA